MRTKSLLALVPLYNQGTSNNHASSFSLSDFHSWADQNGIERHCEVRDEPLAGGGRGLVALETLAPGDVAIRVPLSSTLRVESKDEYNKDDAWAGALTSMLCTESIKKDSSFFAPYIEVGLPKEAPRTVCRWSSTERLALQSPHLVNLSFENAAWRRRQLSAFRGEDVGSPVSSPDFMRMLDLVCSRTLKGSDGSRMLVPFIDNANHAPSEAGGGFFRLDKQTDTVSLVIGERGVKAGEAISLDYGGRTVEDFLLHYGFVPYRCPSDSIQVPIHNNGKSDVDAVQVSWDDCRSYTGHPDAEVRSACADLLDSFPTTLQEDAATMREMSYKNDGNEAFMAALEYRFSKKSLLAQASGVQAANSAFSAFALN